MANVISVGKQAEYVILINTLIALFHGVFFDGVDEIDRRLYEVKTRKILLWPRYNEEVVRKRKSLQHMWQRTV